MSFNVINQPVNRGTAIDAPTQGTITERIESMIRSSNVFLFMKGTSEAPMCGFSANVVGILNQLGVPYNTYNILLDQDIRQGVKEYANWPTYPQLYVKGELIGGNDIVTEMLQSGDLQKLLKA